MKPETNNKKDADDLTERVADSKREADKIKKLLSSINGATIKSLTSLDWIGNDPNLRWNSEQTQEND